MKKRRGEESIIKNMTSKSREVNNKKKPERKSLKNVPIPAIEVVLV